MNAFVPEASHAILAATVVFGVLAAVTVLLIARRRRRAMRAELSASSAAPSSESGSHLQLLAEPRLQGLSDRREAPLPRASGKTVVLADDDPALNRSLAIRLESLGLTVIRSSNAMDALLGAHRTAPDLAILDVAMPSGSGLAVCEMMAADPRCAHIPVIIFTGASDPNIITRCKQLGASYLHKTADAWDQLRPRVIELLGLDLEPQEDEDEAVADHTPAEPEPPASLAPTLSDTALSDTTLSDTTLSDTAPPDARLSDDAVSSSAASSDAVLPDTSLPDTSLPDQREQRPSAGVAEPPRLLEPSPPAAPTLVPAPPEARDPLPAMLGSAPGPEEAKAVNLAMANGKLLCIDENLNASNKLARQLESYGIRVLAASDVESGYLMCYSEKPNAILLDSGARGGRLQEALTHLRSHPFAAGVPILVMVPPRESAAAREMGALKGIRVLAKPVDTVELVQELSSHASFAGIAPPRAAKQETLASHEGPATRKPAARRLEPTIERPKPANAPDAAQGDAAPAVARRRPRVLVIDDDPAVSRAMAIRLRPLGVDVFHAFNGMQGYWTGLDVNPDVIITDLSMPEGEGNYIFSRFQSHPLTKDVPVIVLTGETNPAVKRTMLGLGVSAYFTKPWNFDDLLRELGSYIDLRPAETDRERSPAPA